MIGIALFALVALFVVVMGISAVIIIKAKRETKNLNKFLQAQEDLQRKKFQRMQEPKGDADSLHLDTINVAPVSGLERGRL